jgi:hypothetical protein
MSSPYFFYQVEMVAIKFFYKYPLAKDAAQVIEGSKIFLKA